MKYLKAQKGYQIEIIATWLNKEGSVIYTASLIEEDHPKWKKFLGIPRKRKVIARHKEAIDYFPHYDKFMTVVQKEHDKIYNNKV